MVPLPPSRPPTPETPLPTTSISQADLKLATVYGGEHVAPNDGSHLDGGISDDGFWQEQWRRLIVYQPRHYNLPNGKVGRRFLMLLTQELNGVRARHWNSERFIVFQLVVLQRCPQVSRAKDIGPRLTLRMDAWEKGNYAMLVQNTERTMSEYLDSKQSSAPDPAQRAKIFHAKMLRGDIRGAIRYLTESEKGSILQPSDTDAKSGESVGDVLRSKHPAARVPDVDLLHSYPETPAFVDVDITADVVESVARRLTGSAGLGGTDAHALKHWLLKFGKVSAELREAVASFSMWLANDFPPWAAYRAFMSGRLVALDKCPGVRPIGIGETWRRAFAKALLKVAGPEATQACGIDQLCSGLQAGVEGAVHAMQHVWDVHHQEEQWGFFLIDASNAFNELNRTHMLWTVRREWPSGARFVFNCYKHWATLIVRGNTGTGGISLASKEGVTQGDPLSMFAYGIGTLPLIRQLKQEFPDLEQPWYADDAASAGRFDRIRAHYSRLQSIGQKFGYFPEPSKCVIVVSHSNVAAAEAAFGDLGFKIRTGCRYLGGFIGEQDARDLWLTEKISFWTDAIGVLSSIAKRFPQTAYAGLQQSLQQQWQFVQRVTKGTGTVFANVEQALASSFLPALFGDTFEDDDAIRALASLPIKCAGLALPNPMETGASNYDSSVLICGHLLAAFRRVDTTFSTVSHRSTVSAVRSELRTRNRERHNSTLQSIVRDMSHSKQRTILRGGNTGQWLSVTPTLISGTLLSAQEFRDSLHLRYAHTPPGLPSLCDGCGSSFSVSHGLECKKGGLVLLRHNEIRDELASLASQALTPSAVRDEPLIQPSRGMESAPSTQDVASIQHHLSKSQLADERGDLLIRGLWSTGSESIIDVRVTNVDCRTQRDKDPEKVLASHERAKKKKYLASCLEQRRSFIPFVVSADGLLGREASFLLQRLSALLAEKWGKSYSEVCGFVRARMSIAVVRATHLCLRGSRIPASQIAFRRPQWEDQAGLGLFHY